MYPPGCRTNWVLYRCLARRGDVRPKSVPGGLKKLMLMLFMVHERGTRSSELIS